MNNLNMRRVLKGQTLRAYDGFDAQPMNKVPMGAQDQGAFNAIPNSGGMPSAPAASAGGGGAAAPSASKPAQPNSLLSNPGYSMINNPGASLLSHPDTPSASILPAGGAGSPTYTMQGSIPFGQPVTGRSVQQANGGYQEAQRNPKKRPVEPFGLREGGEIHADLGGMWANAKRAVQGQAPETASEAMNRRLARPAPPPAPPAPAPAPAQPAPAPAAPMGNQTVIDSRMKAAGLRNGGTLRTGHGGDVPGTGTGDKIPAKYEPGEFVVSNDMLDAQPSLRGHLQSLRKDVLAEKGMTPEQADAKALGNPKGLRAMDAGDWANLTKNELGAGQAGVQAMEESAVPRGMGGNAGRTAAIAEQTRLMQQPAGEVLRYTPTPSAAVPPAAPPAAPAVSAPKGIPGRMADAVMNPLKSAGQAVADKATAFAKAADAHIAKSPTLRMAGELAKEYPKTANFLGKVAKVGGTVANAMYSGDVGAGSTLDAAHVEALKKPWIPDAPAIVRPGEDQGKLPPTQASYSNEGRNRPTPAITPKAPKTLRGADGRQYLEGAVTQADHTRAESLINGAFGNRGKTGEMDNRGLPGTENMDMLRNNAASMDMYNQGLAAKGSGIQVSKDANGQLRLSNSTAPEKMQYVDTKGNPTSEYRNTQQYAEGVGVAKRDKALADKMEHDRLVQEAGSSNAAYSGPAQRRLAQEQVTNNQAIEKDKTAALREGHQLDYEGRMAPVLLAQQNQKYIQQVMASSGVNGDPRKAVAALTSQGMGHLTKDLREQIASEQSARAADQADGTARAKAMDDSFKGRFEKVNEKGETVEDDAAAKIAADQFRLATEGKNLTPDQIAEHHHNAMMHAKLVQRLQGKARLRDDGFVNRLNPFGDNRSVPSNLPADLTRSTVNWFDGARTGHGIEKGDHYLGDPSLNIAIPADTPDDELQYLASLKKQRAADKAKLRN